MYIIPAVANRINLLAVQTHCRIDMTPNPYDHGCRGLEHSCLRTRKRRRVVNDCSYFRHGIRVIEYIQFAMIIFATGHLRPWHPDAISMNSK